MAGSLAAANLAALAVVWYFAAGAIALGIVGGVLTAIGVAGVVSWVREKRYVAVHSPIIIMGVGGTDVVKATLIRKPSFSGSGAFRPVRGVMTINRNANVFFALASAGPTSVFIAGGTTTLTGVAVGAGKATVTGIDAMGRTYRPMDVQVEVIAIPAGGVLAFYAAAVARAQRYWTNSWLGNILVNWLGLGRCGLCDEWTEWTSDFVKRHNTGVICRAEKVFWPGIGLLGAGQHVCVRIQVCAGPTCTGPVFYLDPHRETATPVMAKAPYEAKYGLPSAVASYTLWTAPCAGAAAPGGAGPGTGTGTGTGGGGSGSGGGGSAGGGGGGAGASGEGEGEGSGEGGSEPGDGEGRLEHG